MFSVIFDYINFLILSRISLPNFTRDIARYVLIIPVKFSIFIDKNTLYEAYTSDRQPCTVREKKYTAEGERDRHRGGEKKTKNKTH